jgi:REP element-mobilizing transposase RayT
MPNHVHVLFQLFQGESLAKLVGSWKSFTTRRINATLNRHGSLWQDESYDHLIRDENEFVRAANYIRDNPVKAGLIGWRWVYMRKR